jgi:hypothetical protein
MKHPLPIMPPLLLALPQATPGVGHHFTGTRHAVILKTATDTFAESQRNN